MSIFSTKNISVLNEAYYGKKPEFAKIEKLLAIIIQRCHNIKTGKGDIKINGSKELTEIERLFEKAFGMAEMHLTFYTYSVLGNNRTLSPNAFAVTSFLTYFKNKEINKSVDENLVCNVWVDTKFVSELDLNPGELMSTILHELGHCYNASLFALLSRIPLDLSLWRRGNNYEIHLGIINTIVNIIQSFFILDVLKLGSIFRIVDKEINKLIEDNKYFAKFINTTIRLISNFSAVTRMFSIRFFEQFSMISLFQSLQPRSIFGYSDEKFADSFATTYGYGKEFTTFMHKAQQKKMFAVYDVAEKIPILNVGIDFINVANMISIMPIDEHPDIAIRVQSQINKLKRDLNDPNLDPKVEKELMENLKEMEDYVDNVMLSGEENLKKGKFFSMVYNYIMMKVFKGKADIREIFEIVYNHEM